MLFVIAMTAEIWKNIDEGNGLWPIWREAIIWTYYDSFPIKLSGVKSSEMAVQMQSFSSTQMN